MCGLDVTAAAALVDRLTRRLRTLPGLPTDASEARQDGQSGVLASPAPQLATISSSGCV